MLSMGLPQWSHPLWKKIGLYTLEDYCRYFNCIEGNTTLYAIPDQQTVLRWKAMSHDNFVFCFKFPSSITHKAELQHCQSLTQQFFASLDPLSERIGQYWLQLPARFGPSHLSTLFHFLDQLPDCFSYGVEVRHPIFFARGIEEKRLNQGLMARKVNRVMLDSRAVHTTSTQSPAVQDARQKKPRLPVHVLATASQPMIRFIGSEDYQHDADLFRQWLPHLQRWSEDRKPYLFIHTPDMGQVFALLQKLRQQFPLINLSLADLPQLMQQNQLF